MSKFAKAGTIASLVTLSFLPTNANAMLTIAVSGTVDLNFGSMTETGAGTMIVDTAGSRSTTGGVSPVNGGGFAAQGVLSISGSTGLNIDLSMGATAFNVSNGTDSMVVNNFNLVNNGGGNSEVITLPANPSNFNLGATLNVSAGQAEGTYTGTYTVTAAYQ